MTNYWGVPELGPPHSVIRISPDINVPVTRRVKRLIDTAPFRRLSRISQLGLVSFVYPGATHTRMEHSLGVYRNAIDFLQRLGGEDQLGNVLTEYDAKLFLVAALLHDIGHWPFCHAVEDMLLPTIPRHESLARRLIVGGEMAEAIEQDWSLSPNDVANLLAPNTPMAAQDTTSSSKTVRPIASILLQSMLSGPIDIDKLDYLERDSLHAGVPYGRNFDRNRLVSSLCIDHAHHRLAISDKGRTAAEMMVFARYVMFSEVYWHHAVRSATAMLQRSVFEIQRDKVSSSMATKWVDMNESEMIDSLLVASRDREWKASTEGLFGAKRELYKRVAQFDCLSHPEQHSALARKPYDENRDLCEQLAHQLSQKTGVAIGVHDILIDAPPTKLEVQFQLDVRQRDGSMRALGELSPVVHALATKQFDDIVKRVRIFVRPSLFAPLASIDFTELL